MSATQPTSIVQHVPGQDLNTRGYLEPAGNNVTGTRVPARFVEPLFIVLPSYL